MRLIDADAFIEKNAEIIDCEIDHPKYQDTLRELIDEAPTVERPRGEWEFIGYNLFKCTHCGYIADADYLSKWREYTFDPEFPTACLKCGADMRKEGDSDA